jgi:hypothetical protein
MKKSILSLCGALLCIVGAASAQRDMGWEILADVTFREEFIKDAGAYYLVPEFGRTPKFFEGKEITITGYMIPIDLLKRKYVLSRNPFAACFFCGQAGPETIIELRLKDDDKGKKPRYYKLDEYVTFRGKLQLNKRDINYCNYILNDAVEEPR